MLIEVEKSENNEDALQPFIFPAWTKTQCGRLYILEHLVAGEQLPVEGSLLLGVIKPVLELRWGLSPLDKKGQAASTSSSGCSKMMMKTPTYIYLQVILHSQNPPKSFCSSSVLNLRKCFASMCCLAIT